ncbi:unnamed protein product [Arctogadus glacialis]
MCILEVGIVRDAPVSSMVDLTSAYHSRRVVTVWHYRRRRHEGPLLAERGLCPGLLPAARRTGTTTRAQKAARTDSWRTASGQLELARPVYSKLAGGDANALGEWGRGHGFSLSLRRKKSREFELEQEQRGTALRHQHLHQRQDLPPPTHPGQHVMAECVQTHTGQGDQGVSRVRGSAASRKALR